MIQWCANAILAFMATVYSVLHARFAIGMQILQTCVQQVEIKIPSYAGAMLDTMAMESGVQHADSAIPKPP